MVKRTVIAREPEKGTNRIVAVELLAILNVQQFILKNIIIVYNHLCFYIGTMIMIIRPDLIQDAGNGDKSGIG